MTHPEAFFLPESERRQRLPSYDTVSSCFQEGSSAWSTSPEPCQFWWDRNTPNNSLTFMLFMSFAPPPSRGSPGLLPWQCTWPAYCSFTQFPPLEPVTQDSTKLTMKLWPSVQQPLSIFSVTPLQSANVSSALYLKKIYKPTGAKHLIDVQ